MRRHPASCCRYGARVTVAATVAVDADDGRDGLARRRGTRAKARATATAGSPGLLGPTGCRRRRAPSARPKRVREGLSHVEGRLMARVAGSITVELCRGGPCSVVAHAMPSRARVARAATPTPPSSARWDAVTEHAARPIAALEVLLDARRVVGRERGGHLRARAVAGRGRYVLHAPGSALTTAFIAARDASPLDGLADGGASAIRRATAR